MKHAVARDIGGTNTKYALVCQQGDIRYQSLKLTKSENEKPDLLSCLKNIIKEILGIACSDQLNVVGIGMGVPSIVDNSVVLFANNLPELDNQPIGAIIKEYSHLPIFVENDANLMGLDKVRYGAAKNISDAAFFTVGAGIGDALILNRQLYGGYRNRGTELGHIIIDCNRRLGSCGAKGCLEELASVTALINDYKNLLAEDNQRSTTKIDGKHIISGFLKNGKCAVVAMNNHFRYLAAEIVSIINIFAPQKAIIGGGISKSGNFYIRSIQDLVHKIVMKETSCFTSIKSASLGNKAGFLGAFVFDNTM